MVSKQWWLCFTGDDKIIIDHTRESIQEMKEKDLEKMVHKKTIEYINEKRQ
jgi:hypothetical protein